MWRRVARRVIKDGGFSKIEAIPIFASNKQVTLGQIFTRGFINLGDNTNGVHLFHNAKNIVLEEIVERINMVSY
jgi:hypothetical protein